jgi:hypothetical protein
VVALFLVVTGLLVVAGAPSALAASRADRRIARAGLFARGDVPQDWTASPAPTDDGGDAARNLMSCKRRLGAEALAKKEAARAASDEYKHGGESYRSTMAVFASAARARKVFAAYSASESQDCLARLATEQSSGGVFRVGAGGRLELTATVHEVTAPTVGDASARYRTEFTGTGAGLTFARQIFVDLVYVRVGRAVAVYQHQVVFDPNADEQRVDQLVDVAVRRLSAALKRGR